MNTDSAFGFSVETDALSVSGNKIASVKVRVATEIPLTIMANGIGITTLPTSPCDIKELVFGYLFTSGFARNADEIRNFVCDRERWVASVDLVCPPDLELLRTRLYAPGGGGRARPTTLNGISMQAPCASSLVIPASAVVAAGQWIAKGSKDFRETGGVHIAGLFDAQGLLYYCEDVARHNAVDKVIGKALIDSRGMEQMMLVRSGRTSSEIVYKAQQAHVPIMISRGAPTHHAICLARDMGITLIGFARDEEFTIYANAQRVRT